MEGKSSDCKLCHMLKLVKENTTFINEFEFGTLFLHQNQSYRGRCLHVSNIHIDTFPRINDDLFAGLNKELLLISKVIKKTFQPNLINLALLGNTISHLHYHIIPRYIHDPNWGRPPWPNKEKILTAEEYKKLVNLIYTSLEEFHE